MTIIDTPDPIEEELGIDIKNVDAETLLEYIKHWSVGLTGESAVGDYFKDRAAVRGLLKEFGADSGLIVKCVFVRHNGIFRNHQRFMAKHLSGYYRERQRELLNEIRAIEKDELEREMRSRKIKSEPSSDFDLSDRDGGFMTPDRFLRAKKASHV